MTATAHLALALDDLLHHPRYADIAHAACRTMPQAERDQHHAANRDADHLIDALAATVGGQPRRVGPDGPPEWVRLGRVRARHGRHLPAQPHDRPPAAGVRGGVAARPGGVRRLPGVADPACPVGGDPHV